MLSAYDAWIEQLQWQSSTSVGEFLLPIRRAVTAFATAQSRAPFKVLYAIAASRAWRQLQTPGYRGSPPPAIATPLDESASGGCHFKEIVHVY